ncbi:MAG: PAS domain-containing protein [Limisphaerales bacterium]
MDQHVTCPAQFEAEHLCMDQVLAGDPVQFELESLNPQNEPRWSHVEYTPEKDGDGKTIGFVAGRTQPTYWLRYSVRFTG